MARKMDPDRIERDRKRKRIAVAMNARDAAAVTTISAMENIPSSQIVDYLIYQGMLIEQRGRYILSRPAWPPHPVAPRYVQAAMNPLEFLDLIELAETADAPLNKAASAFFKLGLNAYEEEHITKIAEFDFG